METDPLLTYELMRYGVRCSGPKMWASGKNKAEALKNYKAAVAEDNNNLFTKLFRILKCKLINK